MVETIRLVEKPYGAEVTESWQKRIRRLNDIVQNANRGAFVTVGIFENRVYATAHSYPRSGSTLQFQSATPGGALLLLESEIFEHIEREEKLAQTLGVVS